MGPQRFDTTAPLEPFFIPAEVKVLDGSEKGEVAPQRLETTSNNTVLAEVKVLDPREQG